MRVLVLLCVTAAGVAAAEIGYDEVFDPLDPRWPVKGNRLALKKQAFDQVLAKRGLPRLVRAMKKWEAALAKVDERIAKDLASYEEAGESWWAFKRRYPNGPQPPNNADFLAKERALFASQSIKRRERDLHAYAERRAAEVLRGLSGTERKKAVAALAAGLKDRNPHQRVRCADILGEAEAADAAALLVRAAAGERSTPVAAAILRAYARCAPPEALWESLPRYLERDAWPLRAAAVHGLEGVRTRKCVALLVGRFERERGRLLDDLAYVLRRLTGQGFGGDGAAWREWWAGVGADWSPPPAPPPQELDLARSPGVPSDGPTSFFGARTRSERLLYCLDGRYVETWRDEAVRSIESLPESAGFGLVVFGRGAVTWRKQMAPASAGNKKSAVSWLAKLEAETRGDVRLGVEIALGMAAPKTGREPAADTMFLFAAPQAKGSAPITDEPQVAQEVVAMNRIVGVRIHPIGPSSGANAWWLQTIARQFGGVFLPPPR